MSEPLLRVAGLSRHFGGIYAANGVDIDVRAGELHALIGPNGAGKTTLIHLVSGALVPDAGSVLFDGADVTTLSMHERATSGLVRSYQITSVFPHLSALENVRLAVQSRRRDWGSSFSFWRSADADTAMSAEATELLLRVGLSERAGILAADLAHGEQRELELAMALATRPRLLLLDEPMAGMGAEESERMADLIAGLKGDIALLLVEHDMDIVFRLADRLSVLVAGRIVATGTPAEVRENPEVRRAYLGDEIVALREALPPKSALADR
jgi:branched-chain amino acid transport system ATP-binding protein